MQNVNYAQFVGWSYFDRNVLPGLGIFYISLKKKIQFLMCLIQFKSTHDDYFEKLWTSYTPDSLTYRVENRSLLIGVGCMFFSHICGINTTISYMNHILKISNICINSKTISISLGLFQVCNE